MTANEFREWLANLVIFFIITVTIFWQYPTAPGWAVAVIAIAVGLIFPIIPGVIKERKSKDGNIARSQDSSGR